MRVIHLGFFMPYNPPTSSRAGNPCLDGSCSPFISYASSVSGCRASLMGIAVVYPSAHRNATFPTVVSAPAISRIARRGTPRHFALLMRFPPTSLLMHSRVRYRSIDGRSEEHTSELQSRFDLV